MIENIGIVLLVIFATLLVFLLPFTLIGIEQFIRVVRKK